MTRRYITKSAKETENLAPKILDLISRKKVNVLALSGNLGSGKTTFVHGLAKELGIKKRVISPTFVLVREYGVGGKKLNLKNFALQKLYHFDLYRLLVFREVIELGIEEIWQNPQNLIVIEWAEKIKNLLPKNTLRLYFSYIDEKTRSIAKR